MKSQALTLTLAATAVALLVAGCGGGGGGGGGGGASSSLQLSGTAATGAALAGADVEVKCATGTGTATTAANGNYSVTIPNGTLPCMIEVTRWAGGTRSTLHSVVESGTLNPDGRTIAVANVTPVTELIVAHLGARDGGFTVPEASFHGFTGDAFTREQVQAASAAIVGALQQAGIDLGAIDPLKSELVAKTASGPGNAHDQMLDVLGTKVDDDELRFLASQVVEASWAKFPDGVKSAVLAAVGGALPGCPQAVSGMYRTADALGSVETHALDFGNMRMATVGTMNSLVLAADASESCVFTASGPFAGGTGTVKVVIGANGIGNYHADMDTAGMFDRMGVVFPAQSQSLWDLQGTWSVLRTTVLAREHSASQVTFGVEGTVSSCDYDSNWTCVTNPSTLTAVELSDGGISVQVSATEQIKLYGYRAPNGAVALFGRAAPTSNVAVTSKSFIGTRLATLPVPPAGATTLSWDAGFTIDGDAVLNGTGLAPISYTIVASDAAAGTATRQNNATGRIESLRFNTPLAGVRTRDAGTFNGSNFAELVQIPLTGMGVTLSINAVPWGPTSTFIHNIAVVK